MKTKSIVTLLAAALLCATACQKKEILSEGASTGEYLLEIASQDGTRATSSVDLNLANLTEVSSRNVSAQLKRRSGTTWVSVTEGVNYSWSASSADSQKFSGSGTQGKTCTIAALSEGSGTMNVSASLDGASVATTSLPVNVTDSRAFSWCDITHSIDGGDLYSATLVSNFSCSGVVSSDNASFVVGTSAGSLSATTNVSFVANTEVTVYYRYDGDLSSSISLMAESGTISSQASIETSVPLTITDVRLEFPGLSYNSRYDYYEASYSEEGPDMNEDMPTYVSDVIDYHLVLTYSDGTEEEVEPGEGVMSISGCHEVLDSDDEEGWFIVQLTSEKDDITCRFNSYTYGVLLSATIHFVN